MKLLNIGVPTDERALYLRIADAVRRAIRDGQLEPCERIPSTRTLGDLLGAHRQTVMDALGELVAEGWLVAEPRRGYRVNATLPVRFTSVARRETPRGPHPRLMTWRLARDVRIAAVPAAPPIRYSFRSHPDLRLFPFAELRSSIAESLRWSRAERFGYGDPAGHSGLVEVLDAYFRRTRALKGRRILVTHGSQEAISLASQLLVAAGDYVGVEAPGYAPAVAAFRSAGARIVPIRVDREGIDPAALSVAAKKHRLRLLYLTPLHRVAIEGPLPFRSDRGPRGARVSL